MNFFDSLAIAVRSLSANKLRSSLTMLGIIIGVTAVIALMSVGQGAQARITSTFEELGTNVIYVLSRTGGVGGIAGLTSATSTLSMEDAQALANPTRVRSVLRVAPIAENYAEITAGDQSLVSVVHGATPAVQGISNYIVASGQFISERNVAFKDMVAVLGSKAAEELFGSDSPVGQRIKIKDRYFTVIGLLETKGGQLLGVSQDNVVIVPITTYQARLFTQRTARGEDAVQSIAVQVSSADAINEAIDEIGTVLRRQHRLATEEKDDFTVVSQEQIVGILSQVTGIFTVFLGSIAGISLLVGSIGIMNIMLVSVTERTREIGIRKAVGAKRRDILLQFLMEAAMLSLLGGGIGIAGGAALSALVSRIDVGGTTIPSLVSPGIVALAISVSIMIGLISGIYPAMRAARLNPIDALHYG